MTYYDYNKEDLLTHSKVNLISSESNEAIFKILADEMIAVIEANNSAGQPSIIICPVGPVGHYPYFVKEVNDRKLSLANVWFINMDEYLTADDEWLPIDHKLSFRGFMNREVYTKIDEDLLMPQAQRIFPDPHDLERIPQLLAELGKVDACFGGIGINGHVAFNEPQADLSVEEFSQLPTRVLDIDPMTVAVNAVGDLEGAIEMMPRRCVTIGMKEILSAKKIRLGVFREWHRAVLRRAVCGAVTTEFPVTLLQSHPDYRLYASDFVLKG